MHLSWLHEERCLCYSACKETWSDFVDSLTYLLFSEESAWWSSSASSLFLLCLLSLSWLHVSCKVMKISFWDVASSLIILFLSHLLMIWFSMRNVYFSAFVTACLAVELCYEHVWINQSSDLTLINLIKASHDAMPSLNLTHFFKSFSALLLVVQHFLHSSLSSFF